MALADLRVHRLPHALNGFVYAILVVTLVVDAVFAGEFGGVMRATLAAVLTTAIFLGIALLAPGQLGIGDVVTAGWIALTLGWRGWRTLQFGLFVGLLLQVGITIAVMLRCGRDKLNALPLGPALLLGWLAGLLV